MTIINHATIALRMASAGHATVAFDEERKINPAAFGRPI
jgi:hypothetical protein